MAQAYQIVDEPRPGALGSVVVQPFWPLLGIMFGGSWLSWPWFAINAFAVGSPTRAQELALAIGGFVGNFVITVIIGTLQITEAVPDWFGPYLILVHIVWKLGVSYWLFALQSRTFGIYEYYGGVVRNGLPVLIGGYLVGKFVIGPTLASAPLLRLVLS